MSDRAPVPCNGCTACCHGELVLHPEMGDDPARYQTRLVIHPLIGAPALALANKPNGDCIYVGITGCTIHGWAPAICRKFDCRRYVLTFGRRKDQERAVKDGIFIQEILDAARQRPLTPEETAE